MSIPKLGLLLLATLLCACSGVKTYPNTQAKNLRIHTRADSGSMFSSLKVSLDIYRIDPRCQLHYEGSLELDGETKEVGLPANRLSLLVFHFDGSTFLASGSNAEYETMFTPRENAKYQVDVRYADDIYNVTIRKQKPGRLKRDLVPHQSLAACSPV